MVGDEDAVGEMMSFFPARDVEEPVTKEHLRAELLAFRSEVTAEFAALRSEMAAEFAAVRSEMTAEFAAVRAETRHEVANSTKWTIGVLLAAMVTLNGAALGLVAAMG
jgi:anti-sigma factor RsiW